MRDSRSTALSLYSLALFRVRVGISGRIFSSLSLSLTLILSWVCLCVCVYTRNQLCVPRGRENRWGSLSLFLSVKRLRDDEGGGEKFAFDNGALSLFLSRSVSVDSLPLISALVSGFSYWEGMYRARERKREQGHVPRMWRLEF